MAAMPKRRRMKRALLKRARAELDPEATALDYVCAWIAGGGLIKGLAGSLQDQLGESVSRSILSTLVHHLSPYASARIAEARRVGATAPQAAVGSTRAGPRASSNLHSSHVSLAHAASVSGQVSQTDFTHESALGQTNGGLRRKADCANA